MFKKIQSKLDIFTPKQTIQAEKYQKNVATQAYLANQRSTLRPQAPMGFKSRTSSEYFLVSTR